jgi:hypothetical protein
VDHELWGCNPDGTDEPNGGRPLIVSTRRERQACSAGLRPLVHTHGSVSV